MLKTAIDLSAYQLAAGEPFLLEVQLQESNGAIMNLAARRFALSFYATGRTLVETIDGELLTDATGSFLRFARDGRFSDALYGQDLTVELAERYKNGRNVLTSGKLSVLASAGGVQSLDTGVVGQFVVRINMRASASSLGTLVPTQQILPYQSNLGTPAPAFTVLPSITRSGKTLNGSDGTITNGIVQTREWLLNGSAINGADGASYVLTGTEEGKILYRVTAKGDGGSLRVESAPVDVTAAITLGALTLSATDLQVGFSYTINILGATDGSAIAGTVPDGMTINSAARTITGKPTTASASFSFVLAETHPNATNSPRQSTIAATISPAPAAAGDLVGLKVRDATQLDPDGGSPAVGIDGNGWIAEVTLKGMTAPASTNASDAFFNVARLELLVSDPGFRNSGGAIVPTTVYRKIKGRALLRKQYKTTPADVNGRFITQVGSDFTVLVALADQIYAGSTIVSAKVAAGFYTNGSAVSNASSASSLTNASTYAYKKPTAAWLNVQHLRATGDFPVELIAYHRHAMGGRQVAGVKIQARDTTGNVSAEQVVTSTSLSSLVTATGASKVECFKATIPTTALAQGELCFANAKVYPWIGDASAVYDLSVDGTNTGLDRVPNASPHTRLRFLNDKAGTYSGFAYVDANSSGTGAAVGATLAAAKAAPFKTVVSAFAAIKTYNTARGHNDYSGGRIYLGNTTTDTIEYGAESDVPSPSVMGLTWCEIMPDPAATGAVKWTGKVPTAAVPSMICANGLTIKNTPGQFNTNSTFNDSNGATGFSMIWLAGCTFEASTAGQGVAGGFGIVGYNIHWRTNNTSVQGNVLNMLAAGNPVAMALALGNVQTTTVPPTPAVVFAGNRCEAPTDANLPGNTDGYFWVSNELRYAAGPQLTLLSKTRPTVIAGNLGEFRGAGGGVISWNMAADGVPNPVYELLDMHNTFLGNRGSRMYSDLPEARGIVKEGVSIGSVYDDYNIKTDTFSQSTTGGLPGNTGNWKYCYQVGLRSNIALFGSFSGATPNLQNSYLGMAWEPDYSSFKVSNNFADIMALFVNYQAVRNDNGTYPGGGDYHLASATNALSSRVPVAFAAFDAAFTDPLSGGVFRYDLDGKARLTNGTGAAGCYERP